VYRRERKISSERDNSGESTTEEILCVSQAGRKKRFCNDYRKRKQKFRWEGGQILDQKTLGS